MKKRRSSIIALLLVAALALGIGYAALTDELTINGKVTTDGEVMNDTFDELVYFTNATVTNSPASHIIADVSATYGGDTASYAISGMKAVNDKVVMEFTIHNAYSETVWVTIGDHDEHLYDDFVKITGYFKDNNTNTAEIGTDEDAIFVIEVEIVELTDTSINIDNHLLTFNVSDANPNG